MALAILGIAFVSAWLGAGTMVGWIMARNISRSIGPVSSLGEAWKIFTLIAMCAFFGPFSSTAIDSVDDLIREYSRK